MKHDKFDYCDSWDQGTYQTGSTKPPKSRGLLVAMLLIVVIFLAGLTSILGMMDIHPLSVLETQSDTIPVALSGDSPTIFRSVPDTDANQQPGIAISGEPLSALHQNYYHLPAGLYVNAVIEGSNAARQGLVPGDILISLNGESVTTNEELTEFLCNCQVGDTVEAVIFRDNNHKSVTLTIEKTQG
jgi:membrane-associated protease RseP (regulator of RpoE activity)